jgi:hypothetical protein
MSNLRLTFEQMLASGAGGGNKAARRHPSDEEHRIQCACVRWYRYQYPKMHHNLFAVPNGGWREKATAGKMKAEGVLSGVADLILLKSNAHYGALLIEMKTRTGRQADTQRQWQALIEADGYKYVICRSLEDFIREVRTYLADI